MLVTISGTPGSGKTTVARLLADRLGLPHVYAGDLFRREATRRGLSLAELNELAERDHTIDRALDEQLAEYARRGEVVLEGRLAAFLANREGVPAWKVWLDADEEIRARRVARREGVDWREVLEQNRRRQASDRKRYRDIYGWDLEDTSIYDLVLDTGAVPPERVAEEILRSIPPDLDGGRTRR
ncbi:MAG: cytidylate kinase [Candidatus Binatia bacterium]|nr:MAG: cytidylate kinase [Candidatus Binatia bacterium]